MKNNITLDYIKELLFEISKIGRINGKSIRPLLNDIEPFEYFFDDEDEVIISDLSKRDGGSNRRELLTRALLVQAVLDQGPDSKGIKILFKNVVNEIYRNEIRIFHKPIDFFKELGIAVEEIIDEHKDIKELRKEWAEKNLKKTNSYNLYLDGTKQTLQYAISRWGVPLILPILLKEHKGESLCDYIEGRDSAEIFSRKLKSHTKYGLGKSIGNKACHLFVKWYIDSYNLCARNGDSWGKWSYELPFDSNAGRVLFRVGIISFFFTFEELIENNVIQPNKGKIEGTDYIRVTNLRGNKTNRNLEKLNFDLYIKIATEVLMVNKRNPRTLKFQHIPNLLLYDTEFSIGNLDDGLMYIGLNYCFNEQSPNCEDCPINDLCIGCKEKEELITKYLT